MSAIDVLYVSALRENLLSDEKLTKTGVEILSNGKGATLKMDDEVIATTNQRENL